MERKTNILFLCFVCFIGFFLLKCSGRNNTDVARDFVDTVGFAHLDWQVDSILARIDRLYSKRIEEIRRQKGVSEKTIWKVVISPHDDYSYVGYLYPVLLKYVRARTVFLFGVAHKARLLGLKDRLVFGSFERWRAPYGEVKVSTVRNELIKSLPGDFYVVNDSMMAIEHSLEAIVPFLQYYNKRIEIIPVLVPYMPFERMKEISKTFARAIHDIVSKKKWEWGRDFAFVISSDAVHYGDEDWGGRNFAYFGSDSVGYIKAVNHEYEIINNCLIPQINPVRIEKFVNYTVQEADYTKYKWTWCGRYSIPFGLLTAYQLSRISEVDLKGVLVGYATSIDHEHIPVADLRMGITAPANIHHWVGYAAIGYY